MTRSDDIFAAYCRRVQELLSDDQELSSDHNGEIEFREFSALSVRFFHEYKELMASGLPGQTITLAMLGATLNMYRLFGASEKLPQVLRGIADMIDANRRLH